MSRSGDSSAPLLAAMEIGGREQPHLALLQFAQTHSVADAIASLPRAHHESLASLLHEHVARTLSVAAFADESGASAAAAADSLAALAVLTDALTACVHQWSLAGAAGAGASGRTPSLSGTLFLSLQLLHDSLLSLPHPHGGALQNQLSLLFERVWAKQPTVKATPAAPDAHSLSCDALLPMTLSYLLLRCLEVDTDGGGGGGKRSDVARLFAMRDGLTRFDYDDDSAGGLVQLLLRAAMSPLFLRCIEGRRFLSFALVGLGLGSASGRANAEMMRTMHGAIKHQLPQCKATLLPLYADVYVRAWRQCGSGDNAAGADAGSAAGQQLAAFEEEVVQDLMHLAIHSAHPRTARALQQLLTLSFHDPATKRMRGVDEMLARLYEPILWRALKAANPLVRRHAALVLIDVFPLVNPDAANGAVSAAAARSAAASSSFASNDELLQHQLDSLVSLLSDPDVSIRALGVSGICKVLSAYWEMLPVSVCKRLLGRVCDMVHDAAAGAAAVRASVFHGLAYLLDNALSHPLLRALLPSLQGSLFDASESVQLALVDLLHVVKRMRGLSYFEVVPVDVLMLAIETTRSTKLVRRLLALLLNSYFPSSKPMASVLVRVLSLLRSNPRVFAIAMQSLHEHTDTLPDERRAEFVCALYEMLVRNAKNQRDAISGRSGAAAAAGASADAGRKGKKKAKTGDDASAADPLQLDVTSEMGLIETALGALVSLYRRLPSELLEEGETADRVADCFADGGVSVLLATLGAASASARLSLIHLSALLPSSSSPDLREISLPHLLSLSPNAPHADYAPVLECMAAWGRGEEILTAVHAAIAMGFGGAEWFEARARAAADKDDGAAKQTLQRLERDFHEQYKEQNAALLHSQNQNVATKSVGKGSRGKKSSAAAAAARLATDAEEMPLLHPLMALKYLSFLLEHESSRALLLGSGVEWSVTAGDDGQQRGQGRAVGALAAVVDLLSAQLMPACKALVEDSEPAVSPSKGQRDFMTFVHQALQTSLKTNLHVHARIRLLAQRANQMAAEAAEAAATAALASQDADESVSAAGPPVVLVEELELFPRDYESLMDLSTYALLPHWSALVDRPEAKRGSAKKEEEEEEEKEEKKGAVATTPSKGSKKGKQKKKKTDGAASAPASAASGASPSDSSPGSVSSVSEFLRAHFTYLAKFSTELLTLGYFHPQCPLRHWQSWLDQLIALRRPVSDGPPFGAETSSFLSDLLPLAFKSLFQLSVIGAATAGFGATDSAALSLADHSPSPSSSSAQLAFPVFGLFVRSVLTLLGCSGVSGALVGGSPLVKAGVAESLAQFDRAPAVQARVLWAAIESLLDEERYAACADQPDWLLPLDSTDSTDALGPFALLLLTAVARSPACVAALPSLIDSLAERLSVCAPANERQLIQRLGVTVGALSHLADVHVKMALRRRQFVATLLRCADRLAAMAAAVTIDAEPAQQPHDDDDAAQADDAVSATPVRAAAAAAAGRRAPHSGPVPMDLDDDEEKQPSAVKKEERQAAVADELDPASSPVAPRNRLAAAVGTPRAGRKGAPAQRGASADSPAAVDSAMWSALKQSLADKMAALNV